jgi:galactose mutarotase-like enzyme
MPKCAVDIIQLKHNITGVKLSNPFISVTVLPEKGADIYALEDHQTGIDVLWKSPQGLRPLGYGRLAPDSQTAWLEVYEGGWQEILPNGGDPCQYKGVELNFHGESTLIPWEYTIVEQSDERVTVEFSVQLYRTPLIIRRRMSLSAEAATLSLSEDVTNLAGEPIEFMWGHHPAFGAPFISEYTRLHTNAQTVLTDADYDSPNSLLVAGTRGTWPVVSGKNGQEVDLRLVPGEDTPHDLYAYLTDFDGAPWYALTNDHLKIGLSCAWSGEVFRCLWLWQEMHGSSGFPFYKRTYTMAVEPWSSYPGHGLQSVLNSTRNHLTLEPNATIHADLSMTLFHLTGSEDVLELMKRNGRASLR